MSGNNEPMFVINIIHAVYWRDQGIVSRPECMLCGAQLKMAPQAKLFDNHQCRGGYRGRHAFRDLNLRNANKIIIIFIFIKVHSFQSISISGCVGREEWSWSQRSIYRKWRGEYTILYREKNPQCISVRHINTRCVSHKFINPEEQPANRIW